MDIKKIIQDNIKSNEILLAYNECYYSYLYDTDIRYAFLFKNDKTSELRLLIMSETEKTGIGAIVQLLPLADITVGTITNPDYNKINIALIKNSHTRSKFGNPFKKVWYKGLTNETATLHEYLQDINKSNTNIKTIEPSVDKLNFITNLDMAERILNDTLKSIYDGLMELKKDPKPYLIQIKKVKDNLKELKAVLTKTNES